MKRRSVRFAFPAIRPALAAGAVALGFPVAHAAAEPERAAIDAQCPWGRLGDGHGHLVRCLTSEEAARLREPPAAPRAPADVGRLPGAPEAAKTPPAVAPSPAEPPPKVPAASAVVPAEPIGKAGDSIWPLPPTRPPAAEPAPPPPPTDEFTAEIGAVVADSGALSDSQRALRKMRDRLAECAAKNGGLTSERGEVELRFLVQERGRAEGVSIKKKRGLGDAAGKCIADVLDRRFVGFPDEPAVGASLVVTISKKKK